MISTKFILPLLFVLVVFVSLSENLQTADGLLSTSPKLNYELNGGDTQVLTWTIINSEDVPINVEFYAEGEGSELLVFEEYASLDAGKNKVLEIFVVVPETLDDVEYRPTLYVIQKGSIEPGKSGIVMNVRLSASINIKIGDNPIYTPPVEKIEPEIQVAPKVIEPEVEVEVEVEKSTELSIAERMAIIEKANKEREASQPINSNPQSAVENEISIDSEPTMDAEPIVESVVDNKTDEEVGGCLIATATYGSELAPQVQLLREIRDNQLMNSNSGLAFMSGFNQLYYSFSPHIADMERQSPIFKEVVKLTLTPMLTTLSVMEHADTESKVLGLGIGVILMNLGMYMGLPIFGIVKLIQFRKN